MKTRRSYRTLLFAVFLWPCSQAYSNDGVPVVSPLNVTTPVMENITVERMVGLTVEKREDGVIHPVAEENLVVHPISHAIAKSVPLTKRSYTRSDIAVTHIVSLRTFVTGAVLRSMTFAASGSGNEATEIVQAELYLDRNNDLLPDDSELLASGNYYVDDGTLHITLSEPESLDMGTHHFLLSYRFGNTISGGQP